MKTLLALFAALALAAAAPLPATALQAARADAAFPAPPHAAASQGPPAAWRQQDPADSLYRAARESLNRGDYERAVDLFRLIRRQYPRSAYSPDAYYWEAFALYRHGDHDGLRAAIQALEAQARLHPNAPTRADGNAETLATRIQGILAQRGDAAAAEQIARAAAEIVRVSAEAARAVEPRARAADQEPGCGPEDEIRTAALNALLQMDAEQAVPILRQVLANHDRCNAPLRKRAVFLLAQKRTAETEDVLLELMRSDPDAAVRRDAVFWLSQVPTERAVAALEEVLRGDADPDPDLAKRALFALSQHRSPRAGAALRAYVGRADAPGNLREQAIFWLGQKRSAENARYLRELYDALGTERLKKKVIFSLSQMRGEGNDRWLLGLATNSNEPLSLRKDALFWAGQGGAPVDELVALYDRMPDRDMKKQLIFVYSQRRDPAAVDKLIDIARREQDTALRKDAIFWLSQSKDPRVAEVLLEIIGHD